MTRQGWPICLGLLVGCFQPAWSQDDARNTIAGQRAEFEAAYERARAGEVAARADSAALEAYPLYAYLQAARIAYSLTQTADQWSPADESARAFLAFYEGEPVAVGLRYGWLESLARRGQWEVYLDHYRDEVADTKLRCLRLQGRIALERLSGIAPLIVTEWLTPRQLPIECEPVFQWLRDRGPLTDSLTEQRVRLLLESGQSSFARVIARRLPDDVAKPLLAWADLLERPAAVIDTYVESGSDVIEPAMLLGGWSRLARNDPAAAVERYESLIAGAGVGEDETVEYALALAFGLAWDRRPEALEYFARVPPSGLDDYALEWLARAAMWAGDWGRAAEAIGAMSVRQRETAQWRYWAARATEGRRERAEIYESLLPADNYYSALSAAWLGDRTVPHPAVMSKDAAAVAGLTANDAFVRAGELFAVGLPVAALREWRHAYGSLEESVRPQSIHLALGFDWYDLAVATATEHGVFFDYELLYPRPYDDAVAAAAAETGLDPALIYAVIRQESLYRNDAVSSAGARGLMQLRPGTAEQVNTGSYGRRLEEIDLLDPSVNILLGSRELARLLERYEGQLPVALAAYNAGPRAADNWLPAEPVAADVWVENIPYNETRQYVRRVLWSSVVFRWLAAGRASDVELWLDDVVRPEGDGG